MTITIQTTINAPLERVWDCWCSPEHIQQWNNASPDWHTPRAENDLRVNGTFNYRMEARDNSAGFDFIGTYTLVAPHQRIESTLGDGRKVTVSFNADGSTTTVVETFETETMNTPELQRTGWQAILDNFKKHVKSHA